MKIGTQVRIPHEDGRRGTIIASRLEQMAMTGLEHTVLTVALDDGRVWDVGVDEVAVLPCWAPDTGDPA